MALSEYMRNLREKVGNDLLLVPGVAAVIRDDEGRILFVKNAHRGDWGLVGGMLDPGETPAEGVKREVKEETGLEVEPKEILGVFGGEKYRRTYENGARMESLTIVFRCEIIGGEIHKQKGEVSELKYFAEEDAPEFSYPKEVLQKSLNKAIFE